MMSKTADKTHTSTWHPTKAPAKSDSIFKPRPFVTPLNNERQVQENEGYRVPQSTDITDNIRRWDSVRARSSQNEDTSTPPSESEPRKGLGLKAPPPPTVGINIQPKLTIAEPGDKYEQEADRVAAQVVTRINQPASVQDQGLVGSPLSAPSISRVSGGLVAPRMETLQRRQGNGGGLIASNLETSINRIRGGGQPLDVGLRESIGQAMGADLSGVRVHTDAQSDRLNRSIQAKAFTTGQDVFFRQGEYQPRTRGGQELIAHELAHVVQQKKEARLARKDYIQRNGHENQQGQNILEQNLKQYQSDLKKALLYYFTAEGQGFAKKHVAASKHDAKIKANNVNIDKHYTVVAAITDFAQFAEELATNLCLKSGDEFRHSQVCSKKKIKKGWKEAALGQQGTENQKAKILIPSIVGYENGKTVQNGPKEVEIIGIDIDYIEKSKGREQLESMHGFWTLRAKS
ncbi:MAG: DUF4157 domain-containing protein [Crocosphaera sp.]|nr:DUF4157 domain-containing protein [Crocosphaera sp.]